MFVFSSAINGYGFTRKRHLVFTVCIVILIVSENLGIKVRCMRVGLQKRQRLCSDRDGFFVYTRLYILQQTICKIVNKGFHKSLCYDDISNL